MVDGEIKREQGLLADNEKQIALIIERINKVPGAEVNLGVIERDYQTKKARIRPVAPANNRKSRSMPTLLPNNKARALKWSTPLTCLLSL